MLRFDPFRDFDRVAQELLGSAVPGPRTPRFMPMDLYRSGDQYVLRADLPGIDPDSLDIAVDNGVLTLRAQRSLGVDDGVQWISNERFAGTYQRQLTVGDGIDVEAISATYDNGVLTLTLPVAERVKPRRIEVTATGSPQAVQTTAVGGDAATQQAVGA